MAARRSGAAHHSSFGWLHANPGPASRLAHSGNRGCLHRQRFGHPCPTADPRGSGRGANIHACSLGHGAPADAPRASLPRRALHRGSNRLPQMPLARAGKHARRPLPTQERDLPRVPSSGGQRPGRDTRHTRRPECIRRRRLAGDPRCSLLPLPPFGARPRTGEPRLG